MTLSVALQMDPMAGVDITGDSTFEMALEAQRRGFSLWEYHVTDISYEGGKVTAWGQEITVRREAGNHMTADPREKRDLSDFDVILMRQDPPFDMQYIAATHLLDMIHPRTFVVNDPTSVRNAPEKLLVLNFADLMPETLVTRNADDILAFRRAHGEIVVKPLFGNGGAGVFHVKENDDNLTALMETFLSGSREQLMVQRYEPAIRKGDKRILLAAGEPIGGINRIPADGEARANLHVGGRAEATQLTERELDICERLRPVLTAQDLIFTGIDVIGDKLTEINVTSPTGLQELARFTGTQGTDDSPAAKLWDAIIKRHGETRS